ncbi:MAG: hypothetical protein HGA42_13490 [Nostocales cyanobacterium W4_Combined_metabat2_030]|nr:hypothetical protein [Nostocales cyanobacterium W4_Combined_metabat2_030]
MTVPAVLIQRSTLKPVSYSLYPRDDMSPYGEGEIDPDFFWLIANTPVPQPDYDPRIYEIIDVFPIGEELLSCPPHPDYPLLKAYNHTYVLNKRSNEYIFEAIQNAKKDANNSLMSEAQYNDELVFMLAAVNKKADGFTLTTGEQDKCTKLMDLAVKMARNESEKETKNTMVINGLIPNIDEGWERNM